jgi:hypothetical protein
MDESQPMDSGSHGVAPEQWGYEFTPAQDEVISSMARWTGIFAWFALIAGTLMAVGGLLQLPVGAVNVVGGSVYLFIGMWFRGAAKSLRMVVVTEGDDIAHLMSALENLRSAFMAMVVIVGMGILIATFVAGIVAGQG